MSDIQELYEKTTPVTINRFTYDGICHLLQNTINNCLLLTQQEDNYLNVAMVKDTTIVYKNRGIEVVTSSRLDYIRTHSMFSPIKAALYTPRYLNNVLDLQEHGLRANIKAFGIMNIESFEEDVLKPLRIALQARQLLGI